MRPIPIGFTRTFSSLKIRNYRLFFSGQGISLCGTWIQRVGQAWLILELTGSGTAVGVVTALQFLPLLLLAPVGGVIADRFDKRKLLIIAQSVAAISAGALATLLLTDTTDVWMVYINAFVLGLAASIDNPTRQAFVLDMVGRSQLTNALALHSSLVNAARVVGPALAGLLIVTIGIGWCFAVNALSYLAVIGALSLMRANELGPSVIEPRRSRQIHEGLTYVRSNTAVFTPIVVMAIASTFAHQYQVVLPMFARFTFAGNAQTFATMTAMMGLGAVAGGLYTASYTSSGKPRRGTAVAQAAAVVGVVQVATSLAPTLASVLVLLVVLGGASVSFIALCNSTLQLATAPQLRGRVMGLWAVAFLGTTPIGAPFMGWMAQYLGARWALGLGGIVLLVVAGGSWRRFASIDAL